MAQLPKNWAVAHDAPKGSGLSWLMLMMLGVWGDKDCQRFPRDAHDAWAFGAAKLPKNWAAAHDAANGSGLSRLMLMMLGLWGDKVAKASRLMLMMLGLLGGEVAEKLGCCS